MLITPQYFSCSQAVFAQHQALSASHSIPSASRLLVSKRLWEDTEETADLSWPKLCWMPWNSNKTGVNLSKAAIVWTLAGHWSAAGRWCLCITCFFPPFFFSFLFISLQFLNLSLLQLPRFSSWLLLFWFSPQSCCREEWAIIQGWMLSC